jgi:hypothetical protein
MDSKGYNAIQDALAQEYIGAIVSPEPQPREDVEFVTIETEPNEIPALVLNALSKVGLMQTSSGGTIGSRPKGPKLAPVFGGPGSITFRDTNNGF